jgi:DNA-binding Lrp family transcriptional regulator
MSPHRNDGYIVALKSEAVRNQRRLDALDREILNQLRQNGNLSNVELARRVGLTPPPCLRRVKRLEEERVITGYRAVIDPTTAGTAFEVMVSVEINITDTQTIEEFEQTVASLDEVVEARRLFGHPDYLLRVLVADGDAYERFNSQVLISLPSVRRVVSHKTMKRIKTLD